MPTTLQVVGLDSTQTDRIFRQLKDNQPSKPNLREQDQSFKVVYQTIFFDDQDKNEPLMPGVDATLLCVDPGNLKQLHLIDRIIKANFEANPAGQLHILFTNIKIVADMTIPPDDRKRFFKNTSALMAIAAAHPHVTGCSPYDETNTTTATSIFDTVVIDETTKQLQHGQWPKYNDSIKFSDALKGTAESPSLIERYSEDGEFAIGIATNRRPLSPIPLSPLSPASSTTLSLFSEGSSASDDTPIRFLCASTGDVMTDPVVAEDGFTYDRKTFNAHMLRDHCRSPITGGFILEDVRPNDELRAEIQKWHGQEEPTKTPPHSTDLLQF